MDHYEQPKQTPQGFKTRSARKKIIDEALANHLISPFVDSLAINLWPTSTPLRKQPEYLLTPSPVKQDLFSQLLIDHPPELPFDGSSIIEENSFSEQDFIEESFNDSSESEEEQSNENQVSQNNDIRKRKRKSSNQIKILKEHLNGEDNWSKQKIIKMSQITGLSQSQVYKWFWDQKKKQNKYRSDVMQRKMIKKNLSYRNPLEQVPLSNKTIIKENQEDSVERQSQTKPRGMRNNQEEVKNTIKKLRKRLIFG